MERKEITSLSHILSKLEKKEKKDKQKGVKKSSKKAKKGITKKVFKKGELATKKKNSKKGKSKRTGTKTKTRVPWEEYRKTRITHIGKDYSKLLNRDDHDVERLKTYALPMLISEADICSILEIDLTRLKWLTYHKDISQVNHYFRFEIPKKDGTTRSIWAPKQYLKQVQVIIKEKILDLVPIHQSSFGFTKNRSIVDNANTHLESEIVINLDIKDFFFSINYFRIVGMLRSLGYSGKIASILAMLCTEAPKKEVKIKDIIYYVATDIRTLPQGAPTSPVISNIICRRMDKRMSGLVKYYNLRYSRYADDMTISINIDVSLSEIIYKIISIVKSEDFSIKRSKLRILRKNNRQEVTGVTINEDLNVSRNWRHLLRAEIHRLRYLVDDGEIYLQIQKIRGKLMFYRMVNPERSEKYFQMFEKVLEFLPNKFRE